MRKTTRKKIAPIAVTVLVILYMAPLVAMVLGAMVAADGAGIWITPVLLGYALIGGAVIAGVLLALRQRLREIDGGEEEDAKQY